MSITESQPPVSTTSPTNLGETIYQAIKDQLKINQPKKQMYKKLLDMVEPPLLEVLMEHTGYNQSKAALILGLSRSTTRKKLEEHFGEKYFPQLSDGEFQDEEQS